MSEQELTGALQEALSLLSVEMVDHRQNRVLSREQRKGIADTIEGFIRHASKLMGHEIAA